MRASEVPSELIYHSKGNESWENGAKVVCLVPARTDTQWWHDYAMKGNIEFIKGRLKFGGHKDSAPFPSAVVVFETVATAECLPSPTTK